MKSVVAGNLSGLVITKGTKGNPAFSEVKQEDAILVVN